jgi:methionyl-tRNA formyltransferase
VSGTLPEARQDDARATYAPKLTPEDKVIDWSEHAEAILRRIRAMSPEPGAETRFRGKLLKVFRGSVEHARKRAEAARPGKVLESSREGLVVASGEGAVRLEEVALEGRRRMTGAEFVRGYRPEPGEVLG